MKIAVLSDIHGNLSALRAVADSIAAWQPDEIVVAGDIVNRGPLPLQCLDFVLEREQHAGWRVLRGNHEDYVITIFRDPSAAKGAEEAVRKNVRWTAQQVGSPDILEAMPTMIQLAAPDGGEIRIVHASMRHNRDNILVDTPDDLLRQQIAPPPEVFCCGHTHRPVVRWLDGTLVVNAGSVGLPFDGDPRGSYAQLMWQGEAWQADIVRIPYDRAQTAREYASSGFLSAGGPIAPLIFAEFQQALPCLSTWFQRYQEALLAETITPEQAVAEFLAELNLPPEIA